MSIQYILAGLLSFGFFAGADYATYKEIHYLKPFLWIGTIPVFLYAFILGWIDTAFFPLDAFVSTLAWIPLVFFFTLFVYSLFIEIPVKQTYVQREQPQRVVAGGTYSLTRHPAFIWFTCWSVSSIFASRSITLAVGVPVWIVAYIVCVLLEEKLTIMGNFGEQYREYQKQTPMLFPTAQSARRFARNLRCLFTRTPGKITKNE